LASFGQLRERTAEISSDDAGTACEVQLAKIVDDSSRRGARSIHKDYPTGAARQRFESE
jgi:hypothetical protein